MRAGFRERTTTPQPALVRWASWGLVPVVRLAGKWVSRPRWRADRLDACSSRVSLDRAAAQEFVGAHRRPRRAQPVAAALAASVGGDDEAVGEKRGRAEPYNIVGETQPRREFPRPPQPVLGEHERENRGLNTPPVLMSDGVTTLVLHGRLVLLCGLRRGLNPRRGR